MPLSLNAETEVSPCLLLNFLPSGPNSKGRWQKSGCLASKAFINKICFGVEDKISSPLAIIVIS